MKTTALKWGDRRPPGQRVSCTCWRSRARRWPQVEFSILLTGPCLGHGAFPSEQQHHDDEHDDEQRRMTPSAMSTELAVVIAQLDHEGLLLLLAVGRRLLGQHRQ